KLAKSVQEVGEKTIKGALRWVAQNLPRFEDVQKGGFELARDDQGRPCFPVRPIVFGGDDITLVCEGRIALDLAAELLTQWHEHAEKARQDWHACAGVALVKSHYPFFRAYELAAELCSGAKAWLRRNDIGKASALDYEIAAGGAILPLDQRRKTDS